MFRVKRSQTFNENAGGTFSFPINCAGQLKTLNYISEIPSFVSSCVNSFFCVCQTLQSLKEGLNCSAVILFIWDFCFFLLVLTKPQRPPSPTVLHASGINCCFWHPQLGAITLTLTSDWWVCYFVHIQWPQQYSYIFIRWNRLPRAVRLRDTI